ncbi:MAG: cupin domain-containing protein [Pseudomonadota bacterium]
MSQGATAAVAPFQGADMKNGLEDRALARLIAPNRVSDFANEYWEKNPLIVQRGDRDYFADVLSLEDIDKVLSELTFRREDMRVVDSLESVTQGDFMSGREVDVAKVFSLFGAGASIVFERLDGKWPPLRHLCRAVEQEIRQPAQANVYLTPGSSHGRQSEKAQGLKRHYDTHDVFVLQVAGSKTWRLFETARQLPLKDEKPNPPDYAEMEPVNTFDLEAGDTLYIPRGFVHEAEATEETSLHVTLGLISYTWKDLLIEAVDDLIRQDPLLRKSLPFGIGRDDKTRSEVLDSVVDCLRDSGAMGRAWSNIENHFVQSRRPILEGQLTQLAALESIDAKTIVGPRATAMYEIEKREENVVLLFHGAEVAFPAFVEEALRYVSETPSFRVTDIPGQLDENGRLVLVRRLTREGFLTVRNSSNGA